MISIASVQPLLLSLRVQSTSWVLSMYQSLFSSKAGSKIRVSLRFGLGNQTDFGRAKVKRLTGTQAPIVTLQITRWYQAFVRNFKPQSIWNCYRIASIVIKQMRICLLVVINFFYDLLMTSGAMSTRKHKCRNRNWNWAAQEKWVAISLTFQEKCCYLSASTCSKMLRMIDWLAVSPSARKPFT